MINCRVFLWQHWLQDIVCLDEARFSHITNTFCTFFAANSEGNCLVKTGESRRAPCKIRDWKGGLRPFVGGRERGGASPLLGGRFATTNPPQKGNRHSSFQFQFQADWKSSLVVIRAYVPAFGLHFSPHDHSGGFSNPTAFYRWDFYSPSSLTALLGPFTNIKMPEKAVKRQISHLLH